MNHERPFSPPVDENEWATQERALADERAGVASPAGDPRVRSYRLLAHVLAQPPEAQLPPDFARRMAQRVQPPARAADNRLETWLFGLLALAGLVSAAIYGNAWLPSLDQGATGALLAKPWLWALVACLGFSRLSRHWLQHHQAR
ncbi:MAG TPA: hypothetical protein VGU03_04035 [Frateuria sp.]|uniref:hypothetical protein n=1 Tax=Frateuria sp. TaxID=2211372 RepID=UPI002DF5827C|nr:hypothetical protein [Frateuria sp.]